MEVHRQQCQACAGRNMKNLLVRESGLPAVVYVRCGTCGELVARYELADYYQHGKGIESFLSSRRHTSAESGRQMLELFEEAERRALEGYRRALDELARLNKEV